MNNIFDLPHDPTGELEEHFIALEDFRTEASRTGKAEKVRLTVGNAKKTNNQKLLSGFLRKVNDQYVMTISTDLCYDECEYCSNLVKIFDSFTSEDTVIINFSYLHFRASDEYDLYYNLPIIEAFSRCKATLIGKADTTLDLVDSILLFMCDKIDVSFYGSCKFNLPIVDNDSYFTKFKPIFKSIYKAFLEKEYITMEEYTKLCEKHSYNLKLNNTELVKRLDVVADYNTCGVPVVIKDETP